MNAYQHELNGKKWSKVYNYNPPRVRQGQNRKAKGLGYRPGRWRCVGHVGPLGVVGGKADER